MKHFALRACLFGLSLVFFQCTSKTDNVRQQNPADTVVVRDTVVVKDTATVRDTVAVRDTVRVRGPQAFAAASKMNVLYIGVDNPIQLDLAGADPGDVRVQISGGGGRIRGGGTNYTATVSTPGEATLRISGGKLPPTEYTFRVKRIPDPVARLGRSSDGAMSQNEFKAQGGLMAFLDNFDFDCQCAITGFTLTKIARRADPVEVVNAGPRYADQAKRLVTSAKPGDVYLFTNVRARCPGDDASRPINSLAFWIK